jgi:hypothetical protein
MSRATAPCRRIHAQVASHGRGRGSHSTGFAPIVQLRSAYRSVAEDLRIGGRLGGVGFSGATGGG